MSSKIRTDKQGGDTFGCGAQEEMSEKCDTCGELLGFNPYCLLCDEGAPWHTRDGRVVLLREMTTDHVFNCLEQIRKGLFDSPLWHQRFLRELERRGAIERIGPQGYRVIG